jgi:hypothetical protein
MLIILGEAAFWAVFSLVTLAGGHFGARHVSCWRFSDMLPQSLHVCYREVNGPSSGRPPSPLMTRNRPRPVPRMGAKFTKSATLGFTAVQ